ncbi:hypothetical protein JCM10207_006669 [Rhodosporidiobolus poonsookiae]
MQHANQTTRDADAEDGRFSDAEEETVAMERQGSGGSGGPTRPPKLSTRGSMTNLFANFASSSLSDPPPPVPPLPPLPPTSSSSHSPGSPGEEVESLAVTAVFPSRKGSLTPSGSHRSSPTPSSTSLGGDGRRPSADGGSSVRSNRSTHRVNPGATHYFPLVQDPKKRNKSPPFPAADLAPPTEPPSPKTPAGDIDFTPPASTTSPRRSGSVSSASGRSKTRTAVFPTTTPNRSAGASAVFPTVKRPSVSATPPPLPLSPPGPSEAASRSTSTPSLKNVAASSPASFPSSPARHTSPPASSYAPSIAPSSRTNRSGSYAPSIAPSHSVSQYGGSSNSSEGPVSIFMNPEPRTRPLTDLLPKKKLSSLFSKDKSKSALLGATRDAPAGMTYRGKSASVLDAALATSNTWATKRGEQQRAFAPTSAAFGPPAGYRPAHQVQRQREAEEAARAAAGAGSNGQPLSADALAQALAAGGEEVRRRPSIADSMMTIDSVGGVPGVPGVGGRGASAFPTKAPVFAMKPRPKPMDSGDGSSGGVTPPTGLGIS